MKSLSINALVAVLFFVIGLSLADSELGSETRDALLEIKSSAIDVVAATADLDARAKVLMENPELVQRVAEGGAFGGDFSFEAATNMFGRTEDAIDDVRSKTVLEEVGPGSYLVRMPIVNAAFFTTEAGVVLVDTGMGPAGPAILEAIRSVTDQPIHTIIYTHGHVDHAYGTWAIMDAGEKPQIIAHELLKPRFERYIRLRGSLSKYMSQPLDQLPASDADLVWPTRYFSHRLEVEIGGEKFVLQHHKGETDDQLYVWVPGRKALASADYYQGFLPNAGNGKRVQRHIEEWSTALKEMAALNAEILLPAHGESIKNPVTINENFLVLSEALDHIINHTIEGLNSGLRKDQIAGSVELPEHLANHPTLAVQYVTASDISKMIIKRYTGWWNDIPSNWSPSSIEEQSNLIIELAGGDVKKIVRQSRDMIERDIKLASHLADWLYYARPDDKSVQQLVFDVYKARILDPRSNTMEIAAYIDQMAMVRERSRQ